MPLSCSDPSSGLDAAKCFLCLDTKEMEAVKTYLLAVIAGGSTTPETLLAEAKCFLCLDAKEMRAIQTYLLCKIVP